MAVAHASAEVQAALGLNGGDDARVAALCYGPAPAALREPHR
jgi:hypothetical protein